MLSISKPAYIDDRLLLYPSVETACLAKKRVGPITRCKNDDVSNNGGDISI